MSGGSSHGYTENYSDDYNNRYNQARRMQASPPKRPFQTFRNSRSSTEEYFPPQTMGRVAGSSSSTPCPSPSPQSASPARSTGGGSGISSSSSGSADSSSDPGASSTAPSRYFVMKCNNQKNLDISQAKGIWATSATNDRKINRAFQDGKTVYLIFSVQGSGHFQGYARMASEIGRDKSPEFSAPGLSGTFSIEWVKRANVPFMATHQLHNQWNDNRKVQVSRDGQELEPCVGEALLKLWDRYPNYQKRSSPSQSGTKTLLKHSQQGKQQSSPQQQKVDAESPGGRQHPAFSKDSGDKKMADSRKEGADSMGPDGDGAEERSVECGSSPSSPEADSPRTVSSGSQESYTPDLDRPCSHSHSHADSAPQGFPPRGFNFQAPASSAPLISHGVYPPNLQMAPGFNQMYHVGPMGAAVMPSQSHISPRPGMSPVMILQRGSGGSPGQVHPHPGFINQGFGGQAPGAYQGQGQK